MITSHRQLSRRLKPSSETGNGLKPVNTLPNTDHRSPNTEYRILNTENRTLNTAHRSPITDHRLLNTEHRILYPIAATAVLLLAALFRIIALQKVPPGLSQDEVLNADIVGLIRAGQHALFFREGFGHEPLYHYWATPFQILLGDNVLAIRLPSVFLGLLLIAATMRWAKRDFGSVAALVAGLGLAVSWWAIIFSRVGIRPIMQPLFWVTAAWFWHKRPWLAGLFLGLSIYTYTAAQVAFALPILFGLGQLLLSKDKKSRVTAVKTSVIILATTALISLPLYLTWRADPSLLQRVEQLDGPLTALQQGNVTPILQAFLNTVGIFRFTGDPRWTYTLPGRPLFDSVTAVLFFAGVIIALWRSRQPAYTLLLSLLWVGLLPSILTPQSPSIIRMIGALPAVFIMLGLAVSWLLHTVPRTYPRWQPILLSACLLLLLFNMGRTLQTAQTWSTSKETRLNHYQTVLLEIGQHWRANPAQNVVIADTFFEQIDADSLRRNMGSNGQARWLQSGPTVAGALVFPGGTGDGRLYQPEFAPLNPALLAAAGMSTTPAFRSNSVPSFSIYNLPSVLPKPATATNIVFDGRVQLEGYTLYPTAADGSLQLMTYWHVLQPLPWNLTAFVHLLDKEGHIISQFDGLDSVPSQIHPGDRFIQAHQLYSQPANNQPFQLNLGLYTPDNGHRLLIDGESLDFYSLTAPINFDGR